MWQLLKMLIIAIIIIIIITVIVRFLDQVEPPLW